MPRSTCDHLLFTGSGVVLTSIPTGYGWACLVSACLVHLHRPFSDVFFYSVFLRSNPASIAFSSGQKTPVIASDDWLVICPTGSFVLVLCHCHTKSGLCCNNGSGKFKFVSFFRYCFVICPIHSVYDATQHIAAVALRIKRLVRRSTSTCCQIRIPFKEATTCWRLDLCNHRAPP